MKKSLLTFLGLLMVISSFAQSWNNTGNTLQRRIVGSDTSYRFNLGAPGFMYLYTKPQVNSLLRNQDIRIDSVRDNLLPVGLQGQQLKVATENTNSYAPAEPLVYGIFVYTDAQMTRALSAGSASQLQIFNQFKRFSHGTTPVDPTIGVASNNIPGNPLHTNSWAYDTVANEVGSTFNTGDVIGFYSNEKFAFYKHDVTLSSPQLDNDRIGIVLAFVEDPDDMVTNYAYGLDPGDFNWPINTTSPTIPNQHSLILFRNRNGATQSYYVVYDHLKLTQQIIADGSSLGGLFNTTATWNGRSVDVEAVRTGDTFAIKTSQFSDASGGKGSLGFQINVDLNSNPVLAKFKGLQSYGYVAQSQANAFYSGISFSGSTNVIYDLRNGDTYPFGSSGYVLDPTKNLYTDFGGRYYWRNTTEHTFGYILPSGTYDVIVGETP